MMLTDKRKKEIFCEIDSRLAAGESYQAVFDAYSHEFSYREPLARKILGCIRPETAAKYRWANRALIACMVLAAFGKIVDSAILLSQINPVAVLFAVVVPILDYFFIWGVLKRQQGAYFLAGMWISLGIFRFVSADFSTVRNEAQAIIVVVYFISLTAGAVLAFFLQSRLFPKQGFFGPKKDSQGNYIFQGKPV